MAQALPELERRKRSFEPDLGFYERLLLAGGTVLSVRGLIVGAEVVGVPVNFSESSRLHGEVHGDVFGAKGSPSPLVVGAKAKVHGKVKSGYVIINRKRTDPVDAERMAEWQSPARVARTSRDESLEMHPGAVVFGQWCLLKHAERPVLKPAASNDH